MLRIYIILLIILYYIILYCFILYYIVLYSVFFNVMLWLYYLYIIYHNDPLLSHVGASQRGKGALAEQLQAVLLQGGAQ